MLCSDLRLLISRPFIAGLLNTLRVTNFSGGFIKAVFSSRAQDLGLSLPAIQVAVDNSIGTMGQFGFSTSYIPGPGQQDETPLKELVKVLYNHPNIDGVTIGQMTSVRRLYLEASFCTKP